LLLGYVDDGGEHARAFTDIDSEPSPPAPTPVVDEERDEIRLALPDDVRSSPELMDKSVMFEG